MLKFVLKMGNYKNKNLPCISEVFQCVICVFEDILKQFLAKFVGRRFCVVYLIPINREGWRLARDMPTFKR